MPCRSQHLLICLLLLSGMPIAAAAGEAPVRRPLLAYRDAAGSVTPVTTAVQWSARRDQILEGAQAVMGRLPEPATLAPLDPRLGERVDGEGFVRWHLSLGVEGEQRVTAFLFLPTAPAAGGPAAAGSRRPAAVALHPTSPLGKGVVAGLGPKPNRSYGEELAQRGYVVIAPDYPSFGELKDFNFAASRHPSGTMQAIVNHRRCVDYLQTRDDVDPQRIGAIGHSLGGHNAIFLGVFDLRVKAVVSSCGWTPLHDYYGGKLKGWTQDRYMPRIRDVYGSDPDRMPFDFDELVAALAPRTFFSNSPLHDENFAVEGVRRAVADAAAVYRLLGAPQELIARFPDCGHDFPPEIRREAYETLDRVFAHRPLRAVPK